MFYPLACCLLFAASLFAFLCRLRGQRRERAFAALSPRAVTACVTASPRGRVIGLRSLVEAARRRAGLTTAVAALTVLVVTRSLLLALLAWPAGTFARRFADRRTRSRVRARKEEQVLEFVDSLSQSLRAGLSLRQSLEVSLEDIGQELGEEVLEILGDIRMGSGLGESLARAASASTSPSLRVTFGVLSLMHGRGGDLPRILEKLRQRVAGGLEAAREKRVLTSQSRASGYMVSSLPAVFLLLQAALNPGSLRPLLVTPTGNLIVAAAFALNAAAFLIIRRLVEKEV